MDLQTIITTGLAIIGGASVALRAIAPLTKNKTDDKILKVLLAILKFFSAYPKELQETTKVKVEVKPKNN